jgi:hypothetical protein
VDSFAFTFADPEKIRELARRREAWGDSESRADVGAGDREGEVKLPGVHDSITVEGDE